PWSSWFRKCSLSPSNSAVSPTWSKRVDTRTFADCCRRLKALLLFQAISSPLSVPPDSREQSRKKHRKKVELPKWLPETEIAAAMEMTPSRWKCLLQQWSWVCEAAKQRGWILDQRLKVAKPIGMNQLTKLRNQVGEPMPTEFEHVLTTYASKVSFGWSVGDSPSLELLPKKLRACSGCFEDLWGIENLPRLASEARGNRVSSFSYLKRTYLGQLPFIAVGNGDHIAFDMRLGTNNCPVVYLSHDDPKINGRTLARNFVEFVLGWSSVGCVGPDFQYFAPFYDLKRKRIAPYCRNAQSWRQLMSSSD
ncbi:MAG: SMI1/KNR4 family protein, partial [Planctomycetota bacterium]